MSTILITGGSRSDKSSHALHLTRKDKDQKLFIATAKPLDDEMTERIKRHQSERGEEWLTLEEPLELAKY